MSTTRDEVKRIAQNLGYAVSFHEENSRKGDGTSTTYVRLQTRDKQRTLRSLGSLEAVMALDEEEHHD